MKDEDEDKSKPKQLKSGIYFLIIVILITIGTLFIDPDRTLNALHYSLKLFIDLIPVIIIVVIFTTLVNFFINQKKLSSYLGKGSGIKGWIIAIIAGIITHGPIYVWFNMLKEMKEHGMRTSFIAIFLYDRAIKIPLIPVMLYYFGTLYTITLLLVIIITSPLIGLIVEMATKKEETIVRVARD